MNASKPELSFEIIYCDDDLIQIEVKASNGKFSGTATFYTAIENLIEFREKIRGFPKDIRQVVEQEFGTTKEKLTELKGENLRGISFLGLQFYCIDKHMNTVVQTTLLELNWSEREAARGRASFEMRFEPAALDQFVQELSALCELNEQKASLHGYVEFAGNYF